MLEKARERMFDWVIEWASWLACLCCAGKMRTCLHMLRSVANQICPGCNVCLHQLLASGSIQQADD